MIYKQIKTWLPISLFVLFFLVLIFSQPYIRERSSLYQQQQLSFLQKKIINDNINSLYNYTENGETYKFTFLEFGSTHCSACKNMEAVMEKIKQRYSDKVKVVFINVMEKSSKEMVNYYGVAAIPTQVLLDKEGKEYFRHNGFIPENELAKHFD